MDDCWHSLTIVHTAQRPSLLVAAFHAVTTCHLTIYIDGLSKRQIKDFKYVPLINDPINLASIGAPSQRPSSSKNSQKSDGFSMGVIKAIQPWKVMFPSKPKISKIGQESQALHGTNIITIEPNSQDSICGESASLYGQLACVWVLAETLNESQVKFLHSMGNAKSFNCE